MRRIVYGIVIAAVLAAAAYIALFILYPGFEKDPLSYDDTLHAPTELPVRISRDVNGVPEISAANKNDLFFAIGYVHAQDRINTMEYYRAIAAGYSDKVIEGDDGKMIRRLVSILSLESKADEIYAGLTQQARGSIDNYVNGINAWAGRRGHFKRIGKIPLDRSWKAEDVIAIYLLREWADSYISNGELAFPVSEKRAGGALTDFYPRDYITPYNEKYLPYVSILRYLRDAVKRCLGENCENFSVFVPSAGKEPSRLLINDERAEKTFPSRYPLRFAIDGVKYYAASDAGVPFLKAVISDKVSYSIAPAKLDAMDFYLVPVEKLDGELRYSYDGRYRGFETRKLTADKDGFSFRTTEFGPVISDIVRLENELICIVTDPLRGNPADIGVLLEIPFYGNAPQMRIAVSSLQCYPKSVLIAADNDASSALAGLLPERRVKGIMFHEYPSGRMVNLSSYRAVSRGVVVSSSRINGNDYPSLKDYAAYAIGEKEDACLASLRTESNISSFMKVINSSESPSRERLALAFDKFLVNMPITSAKLAKIYLSEWKGEYSGRSIAPTILQQLYFSMMNETLGDDLGDESDLLCDYPQIAYDRLSLILERGDSRAFDNIMTADEVESMDKVFNTSFIKAMRMLHRHYGPEMGKWRWDRVGKPVLSIPFERSSRFSFDSDSYYNDTIHYESEVSCSEKNNEMSSTAITVLSMMKWGDVYWGGNFPVSLSAGSEYYGNALTNRRMVQFEGNSPVHAVQIIPDGSAKRK